MQEERERGQVSCQTFYKQISKIQLHSVMRIELGKRADKNNEETKQAGIFQRK